MFDQFLVIGGLVLFILGMLVGNIANAQTSKPVLMRAQRAEGRVRELQAQLDLWTQVEALTPVIPEQQPVAVHVHIPPPLGGYVSPFPSAVDFQRPALPSTSEVNSYRYYDATSQPLRVVEEATD